MACRPSFPNQRSNPGPQQWKCEVLTTGPPEDSKDCVILNDSYQQRVRARVAPLTTKGYLPFYLEIFEKNACSGKHLTSFCYFGIRGKKKIDSPPHPAMVLKLETC